MELDPSYSPDVEIDENGRVVAARDIKAGERYMLPLHMIAQVHRQSSDA